MGGERGWSALLTPQPEGHSLKPGLMKPLSTENDDDLMFGSLVQI